MKRLLSALAASALLASGAAIACNDMKVTDGGDGGVPMASASSQRAPAVEKAPEAPLVVKQKQPTKKATASGKPLPEGATLARTGT